jgi:hypothetical protein
MPLDTPSTASNTAIVLSLLRDNTPVSFAAHGPSMNPTVRDGETVQVQPIRPAHLRPGAILLYPHNGRLVLHRLVRIDRGTGRCLLTGDATLSGTESVSANTVEGVAQWVQRGGKVLRLDSRRARLLGRTRFALRPLRRLAAALWRRIRRN